MADGNDHLYAPGRGTTGHNPQPAPAAVSDQELADAIRERFDIYDTPLNMLGATVYDFCERHPAGEPPPR